jgi:hypothetical protein
MDTGYILGIALAALFIILVAYRAYKGDYRKHMRYKAPAEYAGTGIMETGSAQSFGKKDLKDRIVPETAYATEEPKAQTDPMELYHSKASLLLKLLANVKKTEGIREVSIAEITSLETQIEEIKKGLEGAETKYDLRESEVRMSYASSRINWLIKSYPRLRNDADTSALVSEIRKINHRLNNIEEV